MACKVLSCPCTWCVSVVSSAAAGVAAAVGCGAWRGSRWLLWRVRARQPAGHVHAARGRHLDLPRARQPAQPAVAHFTGVQHGRVRPQLTTHHRQCFVHRRRSKGSQFHGTKGLGIRIEISDLGFEISDWFSRRVHAAKVRGWRFIARCRLPAAPLPTPSPPIRSSYPA